MITLLALALTAAAPAVSPELATALREQVRDPASVTQLRVCTPGPDGSQVLFFSARNGFGGLSGAKVIVAVRSEGHLQLVDPGPLALTPEVTRKREECAAVSDEELHVAMGL